MKYAEFLATKISTPTEKSATHQEYSHIELVHVVGEFGQSVDHAQGQDTVAEFLIRAAQQNVARNESPVAPVALKTRQIRRNDHLVANAGAEHKSDRAGGESAQNYEWEG